MTLAVAAEVNKEEQNLGIVIDAYGAGHLWSQLRSKEWLLQKYLMNVQLI